MCGFKLIVKKMLILINKLDKGVDLIEKLLKGEDIDENDELKKNQHLQLQIVTGVLKDDYCEYCHEPGHRTWSCPNKNVTKVEIICAICHDRSHPTSDCPDRKGIYNLKSFLIES